MKSLLQLNLNQQSNLTPQPQQAIKLLQLSTLELQQEIQQQLELNPLLETAANEEIDFENGQNMDDEFEDFQWSHLYTNKSKTRHFNENEHPHSTTVNLQDHLRWQLHLTSMSNTDKIIALTLIDATNENGFLTLPLKDLYTHLIKEIKTKIHVNECEAVRHRLQRFDPIGCVSVNLAETLLIQLEQLHNSTLHLSLAKDIIQNHIDLLGQHNYPKLLKIYPISKETLSDVLKLILHLNPRPGNTIEQQATESIFPDLIVKKIKNQWCVDLNPSVLPKLSINAYYASLIHPQNHQSINNKTDILFLRNHLQEARCFLKNIQNRQETLLSVARYIVQFQKEFFKSGESAMKPLILNDVATALNLHESTISRATTQKFIHTPRGLFELKYFFSNHLPTLSGGEYSSISIRAHIKKIIANEDSKTPFSDRMLANMLCQQGFKIARRTITKYRKLMDIAPSNKRKSF